jgi:aspartate/methionine/tyrosine aminotransferase
MTARQCVADEFARRGVPLRADRVVLTSSTSEAYSTLFKLLCDPGDVVLAPRPSYPLVEHLAGCDGVAMEQYRLDFHGRWAIDTDGLGERLRRSGPRVGAIVVITPNNPTGSVLAAEELDSLATIAADHQVALIVDEVFADYPIGRDVPPPAVRQQTALTFSLGGLSTTAGLPQLKVGWCGVSGPETVVCEALERLETICDAYLSVSTPVQVALPRLLEAGGGIRAQIQRRVCENYAHLVDEAGGHPACTVLPVEAGWYAVVQIPSLRSEEEAVVGLLEHKGVLVHPGYFFDFEREAFLVISLLPESEAFSSTIRVLFSEVASAS